MCIKVRKNELGTVKALMTMTLNALIADIFDKELDELEPHLSLTNDLLMDKEKQQELSDMIAEYFDGLLIDFSSIDSLEDLFNCVVEVEFETIPSDAFLD